MSTTPQLKPMSAGDILDQAIRIYRHNFIPLIIIMAVVSVPVLVLQAGLLGLLLPFTGNLSTVDPERFAGVGAGVGIVTGIIGFIGGILVIFQQGAITHFVSERFLGRSVTVRQAYGRSFSRWLALLIAALLIGLAVGGLLLLVFGVGFIPLIGLAAVGGNDGASALAGVAVLCMCALFIPALLAVFFFYTRWAFWIQTIVIENYNSTGGMGRSWKLVKGTFWRVFGFLIILTIIVAFFTVGPIYLISVFTIFLPNPFLGVLIQSVASGILTMIATPLQYAALTILFYDLLIRKEGFDLQMQLGDAPSPPAAPPMDTSPLFSEPSS